MNPAPVAAAKNIKSAAGRHKWQNFRCCVAYAAFALPVRAILPKLCRLALMQPARFGLGVCPLPPRQNRHNHRVKIYPLNRLHCWQSAGRCCAPRQMPPAAGCSLFHKKAVRHCAQYAANVCCALVAAPMCANAALKRNACCGRTVLGCAQKSTKRCEDVFLALNCCPYSSLTLRL